MSEQKERFERIMEAVRYGINKGIASRSNSWNIVGFYDDGPVEYDDPRINVVTRVLGIMNDPFMPIDRNLNNPTDLAEFGNAIVYALDYFEENYNE